MSYIVFDTPGLLDIRAITTMGLNAKPNTNSPIGYFGTGLKFAIATLLREGCEIWIQIGRHQYQFEVNAQDFREKEFGFITMKRRVGRMVIGPGRQLGFTTELGKNWKMWMAFRELYSNTLDENGEVYPSIELTKCEADKTRILIKGEKIVEEYDNRFNNFCSEGLLTRNKNTGVECYNRPSQHVFYRGMRVLDLQRPALFTYNILSPLTLTEDRTARSWDVEARIKTFLTTECEDDMVLDGVLKADKQEHWEGSFDFVEHWNGPSPRFISIGLSSTNYSARRYIRDNDVGYQKEIEAQPLGLRLRLLIEEEDWSKVLQLIQDEKEEVMKLLIDAPMWQDEITIMGYNEPLIVEGALESIQETFIGETPISEFYAEETPRGGSPEDSAEDLSEQAPEETGEGDRG